MKRYDLLQCPLDFYGEHCYQVSEDPVYIAFFYNLL
jgi:hypothetical protein